MKIMLISFLFIVSCGSVDRPKVQKSIKGDNYILYLGKNEFLIEQKMHSNGYYPDYKSWYKCDTIIDRCWDDNFGLLLTGSGYWERHLVIFNNKEQAEKTLKSVLRQREIRDSLNQISNRKYDSIKQYTTYQ